MATYTPRLAFRVGVTGKRDLLGKDAEIRERIRHVLTVVKAAVEKLSGNAAYGREPALLRAVSPLAAGTDQIFAEEALKLGYVLESPLPFRRDEYRKDFSDTERAAFDRLLAQAARVLEVDAARDNDAYRTVGDIVLDQSDLLLAVWDGQPPKGPGGTREIVELARDRGMPVVQLRLEDGKQDQFLPCNKWDADLTLVDELVTGAVQDLLHPPAPPATGKLATYPERRDAQGAFVDEDSLVDRVLGAVLGAVWKAFYSFLHLGRSLPAAPSEQLPASDYRPLYERFDGLANLNANLYRGAFFLNYFLGLLAVFFALFTYADKPRHELWHQSEFVCLVVIFLLLGTLVYRRWHFRSVDTRYLAEQYRVLCYIDELGLTAPPVRPPAHQLNADLRKTWMEWRLRSFIRSRPMPAGVLDQKKAQERFEIVKQQWVKGQLAYHHRNAQRAEAAEHRLHLFGLLCAGIALGACLAHFKIHDEAAVPWLTVLAAGFPAAAAGCHAISTHAEFRRLAERYEAMEHALETTWHRLEKLTAVDVAKLRRECSLLAALMIEEVVDWQILYRKPAPPPG